MGTLIVEVVGPMSEASGAWCVFDPFGDVVAAGETKEEAEGKATEGCTVAFVPGPEEAAMTAPVPESVGLAEMLGVKVGDFFYSSWGYDQTNIDFYKVVGITPSGKSVKVRQWSSKRVGGSEYSDSMVPGESAQGPVMTKRLSDINGRASFTLTSYANGYYWDGKPKSQTASGYGH